MKNPIVIYSLIRLGIFAVILAVLLWIGFDGIYSTFIAAALALAISLFFFDKQRNAASAKLYEKMNQKDQRDKDSAIEDETLGN